MPALSRRRVAAAGHEVLLGDRPWQVHAAPGHDPHSVVLFEPQDRILISADALWENGFGVVFPELEGDSAFADVAATLDVIEHLAPRTVIPGHGPVFTDAARALDGARKRLDGFVRNPAKHALYAAKVLLKYKLLEWQQIALADLLAWARATPYFGASRRGWRCCWMRLWPARAYTGSCWPPAPRPAHRCRTCRW
jgi:glyoxylase-like metal-dependent hydrolase (beta-lactamase superfamily II)